jgi:hypothetical protein
MEIQRDVTLKFFRSCPVNECEIERNGVVRKYNLTEASIGRIQDFIRRNRIETKTEFKYFTEITFICDKEVYESEEEGAQ